MQLKGESVGIFVVAVYAITILALEIPEEAHGTDLIAGVACVQNASDPSELFDIEGGRWSRVDQSSATST
jgi:hypothetical protein